MKIKKNCFSTKLSDLYGRDGYDSYVTVGREYWYFGQVGENIVETTKKYWNKLKVTYIRSGCMFFEWVDAPELGEEFCPLKSFMVANLVLADLDPIKDLGNVLGDIEYSKLTECFNNEHTIIHNWPNEKEIEIDENELFKRFPEKYFLAKLLEVEDNKK